MNKSLSTLFLSSVLQIILILINSVGLITANEGKDRVDLRIQGQQKISDASFSRHIRPQIHGLWEDFKALHRDMNPINASLWKSYEQFLSMYQFFIESKKVFPHTHHQKSFSHESRFLSRLIYQKKPTSIQYIQTSQIPKTKSLSETQFSQEQDSHGQLTDFNNKFKKLLNLHQTQLDEISSAPILNKESLWRKTMGLGQALYASNSPIQQGKQFQSNKEQTLRFNQLNLADREFYPAIEWQHTHQVLQILSSQLYSIFNDQLLIFPQLMSKKDDFAKIEAILEKMNTLYPIFLFQHLPNQWSKAFDLAYHDFFSPLKNRLQYQSPRYLLEDLTRLNISLNLFFQTINHSRMVQTILKRHINLMQQRWNSILKVVYY